MGTTVSAELVHHGEQRDRIGRQRMPAERRRQLLAAFRESGLTRSGFARREGIRYTTFCTWVQKEEDPRIGTLAGTRTKPKPAVPTMRFAQVGLPPSAARGLEVRMPDGTTLRGACVEELAGLVRALPRNGRTNAATSAALAPRTTVPSASRTSSAGAPSSGGHGTSAKRTGRRYRRRAQRRRRDFHHHDNERQ